MTNDSSRPPSSTQLREESIDAAALGSATLAAVLTVVIPKGPFDLMSIAIGVTLAMFILAYEGRRHRGLAKTLAFSASTSFALLLVAGPILELCLHGGKIDVILNGGGERDGFVKPWMNTVIWLAVGCVVFYLDRRIQRRRDRD